MLDLSDAALTHYRRTQVGFVWQQGARNLIAFLTAQENVELPMTLAGAASSQIKTRAEQLLKTVGLGERRNHRLSQLSGGEQQRVAIARALINDPLVVLADEPTGNLDEDTGRQVLGLLDRLTRQAGKNMVMVTHSAECAGYAERILQLRDGRLIGDRRAAEATMRGAA